MSSYVIIILVLGLSLACLGFAQAAHKGQPPEIKDTNPPRFPSPLTGISVMNGIGGKPVPGLTNPNVRPVSIGGQEVVADGPKMLWHVGVYSKDFTPYKQICGGTLVTRKAVISAAHCFWSAAEGAMAASHFAVGAGKRYRPYNDAQDLNSQNSDVSAIHIPVRYRDSATSFQEDIAVLTLTKKLKISLAVRPACVNFDEAFDNEQLTAGNIGTVLGWGLTKEDGLPSQVLNYLELPAVGIEDCLKNADSGFLRYITSDKICAGVTTGKALCRGDSGGGLVLSDGVGPALVPYLRGVASTAPRNDHRCNAYALAALTHVRAHRSFLHRHIKDLEAECIKNYPQANAFKVRYGKDREDSGKQCANATNQTAPCVCQCYCNNTKANPK